MHYLRGAWLAAAMDKSPCTNFDTCTHQTYACICYVCTTYAKRICMPKFPVQKQLHLDTIMMCSDMPRLTLTCMRTLAPVCVPRCATNVASWLKQAHIGQTLITSIGLPGRDAMNCHVVPTQRPSHIGQTLCSNLRLEGEILPAQMRLVCVRLKTSARLAHLHTRVQIQGKRCLRSFVCQAIGRCRSMGWALKRGDGYC